MEAQFHRGGATEAVAADLSRLDDTVKAVSGSRIAFLVVGLKYDVKLWRALWPPIMRNAIEACKSANARLVLFNNVYMYGNKRAAQSHLSMRVAVMVRR